MNKNTKLLLILRHAKSSWEFSGISDHDRPLNSRGKRDAPRMGRKLLKEQLVPHLIISSSAVRAHSTAKKVAKACRFKEEILIDPTLYDSGQSEYLNVLINQEDRHDIIMLVGHNPISEQLVEVLTGEIVTMPTCAVACVRLPIRSWRQIISQTKGELLNLWRPKELPDD
ncbi:MAG TPA: histidine phosphatase family protein [Nitrososphaeraceae archaeon]|nr:histidine phosphatase family protein [Nitrososphaeraceae archaeon]